MTSDGLTGTVAFKGVSGTITGTGAASVEKVKAYFDTDTDATGIEAIDAMNAEGATYYDMSGRKTNGIQPGINVVRTVDGKSYKVIIK